MAYSFTMLAGLKGTEAKLDALIRLQAGERAEHIIAEIDRRYLRANGHSKPHRHGDEPVVVGREW